MHLHRSEVEIEEDMFKPLYDGAGISVCGACILCNYGVQACMQTTIYSSIHAFATPATALPCRQASSLIMCGKVFPET